MSYAEAKQIALLRVELRTCWENQDYAGAGVALSRLSAVAGNDNELNAEVKRWAFKLQAVYDLPAGFMVSANFVNHDGAHLVRRASARSVTDIPESPNILLQKRGTFGRLPDVSLFDMRLQKDFKLKENVRFSVFVDALNLLNEDAYEGVQSTIVTSSVFNYPFDPVDPRRFMLGAKLRF